MELLNLTPHAINVQRADGSIQTFEPSGTVARVASGDELLDHIDGIDIVVTIYDDVENVPPADSGIKFLVSGMVLAQLGDEYRGLAYAPNTGPAGAIRNDKGHIVAVKSLIAK